MNVVMELWLLPTLVAAALLLAVTHTRLPQHSRGQRVFGEVATGLLVAGLPFLVVTSYPLWAKIGLVVLHMWLFILPLRLIFGRLDDAFLRASMLGNVLLWLGLNTGIVTVVWASHASPEWLHVEFVPLIGACVAIGFIMQLTWALRRYGLRTLRKPLPLAKLPTVSVCIPARNEDAVLMECIQSVVASDYPKLEVLVLDDCSQDKTAEVVKQFAHNGVRFVQGDTPATGWLGKNQAMQTLSAQASGELLIFMGVDVRLQPHSISRMVHYALATQAQMVSVVPQNLRQADVGTIFGTLQYFWQTVWPLSKRHVPVSSKMWLINAGVLKELGGFKSVQHKIIPEMSFACRLSASQSYRFLLSNSELGVTEDKKWRSQIDTSLRVLYPTFKRQPFYALLGMMAIAVLLVTPFVWVALGVVVAETATFFGLSCVAAVLLLVAFALVRVRTHPRTWWLAVVVLPVTLVQEIVLITVSVLGYEFGEVNWKGRNVCYPVISADPLPTRRAGVGSSAQTSIHG